MSLGPNARDLLASAEGGDDPTAADAARVRAKLAGRFAIAAGASLAAGTAAKTASAGTAAGASVAATGALTGAAAKALVAVALIGSVAATTAVVRHVETGPPLAQKASSPKPEASAADGVAPVAEPEKDAPVPMAEPEKDAPESDLVPIPIGELPSVPTPPAEALASRRAQASSKPAPTPTLSTAPTASGSAPPDATLEEASVLRQAQSALAKGDGAAALARVREHERRFPQGVLAEERSALRVFALCAAGDGAEARAAATAFVAASPRSPLLARVRQSCAERPVAPR